MRRTMKVLFLLLAVMGLPLTVSVESSHALPSFGSQVDTACQTFNGTTPFADKSCALCHTSNSPSTSDLNQNGQFFKGNNLTAICPVKNVAPIANAGPGQTVTTGTTVTLNGSGSSDADGNPLTYLWSFISIPSGSGATLTGPTTVKPTFLADKTGQYVVQLIVNDGVVNSTPATVTITTTPGNTAPVANAGPDQSVQVGATVTLNGSGSSDVDKNALTYDWSFVSIPSGSATMLSNPTAAAPSFVADKAGQYVVQLVVNDGTVNSTPDTVTIAATTGNTAPVANAGPDQTVAVGASVILDGTASHDAEKNALTYQWALTGKPAGSVATLANSTTAMPNFVADQAGQYIGQLIVNDGTTSSAPDTVIITAGVGNTAPVANAGPDQIVAIGTTVILDGTASRDADGNALIWNWALTTKPTGSAAALNDPVSSRPSFTVDKGGEYVAQLIVNDGKLDSRPATVMIKTTVMPPARGIYISRARWNAETGKLLVAGRAPNGASVEILDAATGASIATGETGRSGRFRLYVSLPVAPCALVAKASGLVSNQTPVAGAPASCATVKPPRERDGEQEDKSLSEQDQNRGGKSLLKRSRQDR